MHSHISISSQIPKNLYSTMSSYCEIPDIRLILFYFILFYLFIHTFILSSSLTVIVQYQNNPLSVHSFTAASVNRNLTEVLVLSHVFIQ
jgi:hypothetical protein